MSKELTGIPLRYLTGYYGKSVDAVGRHFSGTHLIAIDKGPICGYRPAKYMRLQAIYTFAYPAIVDCKRCLEIYRKLHSHMIDREGFLYSYTDYGEKAQSQCFCQSSKVCNVLHCRRKRLDGARRAVVDGDLAIINCYGHTYSIIMDK